MRKPSPFALAVLACVAATTTPVAAQVLVPPSPEPVTSLVVTVNDGPGDQTDPHVSGDLAAYTDGTNSQSIRVYRFSTAVDSAISAPAGASDRLSDVSGEKVSFSRRLGGCNAVMVFDATASTTTEIAPQACAQRVGSAVGNSTVAFLDLSAGTAQVAVADIAGGAATQLSSGSGSSQSPSVSPSGDAVVWEQCLASIINCDIMRSVRSAGVWGEAQAVASATSPEANPDTDGTTVVYDANRAGSLTGRDIYFQPLGGGAETQLQLAGDQRNPSISGGVIAFESRTTVLEAGDIYVYVIATNTLFQVTASALINDQLTDVSVLDNGDIRVVWSANDGLAGDYNIYATTFTPAGLVHYEICPLYDPLVAKRSGSAYPIKVQLCDASGQNLSSESIALHAISVTQASTNAPGPLDDTGNANPDFDFRYDASLAGYIFNLSTQGLSRGTYRLNFTVGPDPTVYSAPFAVK